MSQPFITQLSQGAAFLDLKSLYCCLAMPMAESDSVKSFSKPAQLCVIVENVAKSTRGR